MTEWPRLGFPRRLHDGFKFLETFSRIFMVKVLESMVSFAWTASSHHCTNKREKRGVIEESSSLLCQRA